MRGILEAASLTLTDPVTKRRDGLFGRLFQVEADLTSNRCDWNLELGRPIFTRLLFLTF
jgi:hypothetical protein